MLLTESHEENLKRRVKFEDISNGLELLLLMLLWLPPNLENNVIGLVYASDANLRPSRAGPNHVSHRRELASL